MTQILIPAVAMAALGLVFGLGLAYALKLFKIEVDSEVALIITKLPGANCGACGKAGCLGFAEALKKGESLPTACVAMNEESRKAVAKILGVEYNPKIKTTAVVLCNGGRNAKDKYQYTGIKSCKAATLVFGGYKECIFGCLSLGDCVKACPFDAIKIGDSGMPEVDVKKCTACGRCVKACPRGLLGLIPLKSQYYIKCSSKDPGGVVIKACKVGCIACGKCVKICPVNAITIKDNLARIDYQICTNCGKCIEVCPTNAIARRR